MNSTATNGYKRQRGLTVEQQNAIDLLITGKTDAETAELVGVHRVTVTKWRLSDPWFQAELNCRRLELWGAAAERLRALLPKALSVLERELDRKEYPFQAAVQVIKLAKLSEANTLGPGLPTDAEQIIGPMVQAKLATRQAERQKYQNTEDKLTDVLNPSLRKAQDKADGDAALQEVLDEIDGRLAHG
jgi:hypothetical protein